MTDAREATKDGKDASFDNIEIEEKETKFAFNGKSKMGLLPSNMLCTIELTHFLIFTADL